MMYYPNTNIHISQYVLKLNYDILMHHIIYYNECFLPNDRLSLYYAYIDLSFLRSSFDRFVSYIH